MDQLLSITDDDWFDDLDEDQQADILDGIREADLGETVPHAEAVKLFEKWGLR